ncbi:MAG: hypothetical protein LiPW39_136 [Parcubacteria group bacterium LiPW_39]|nr:MAG: hypothetical protein LiPW39_136 [Parcubacteria group bacterium LiPW_39]
MQNDSSKFKINLDSAIFYTSDIEKAITFYESLGLKLEYRDKNFVSFIFNNGAKLGIKDAKEEREVPGKQTVFISVQNIEPFYENLKENNFNILKELTVQDWGKNFSILDPDNNKVQFVEKK